MKEIFFVLFLVLAPCFGALYGKPALQKKITQALSSRQAQHLAELDSHRRGLQEVDGDCSICGQYDLLDGAVYGNTTCSDWNELAKGASSTDCPLYKEFFPICCRGPSQYKCQQKVRNDLLGDDFDFTVAPIKSSRENLNITVSLRYDAIGDIDVQLGSTNIYVTITNIWKDERLKWDINEENCVEFIPARGSFSAELTEIWVPDLDLLNRVDGLEGFKDEPALILSDGTVFWFRSGSLKAFCQFTGLAQIPFDTLGCQFLFGAGNANRNLNIDYQLDDVLERGVDIGNFDFTYNEYVLNEERSFGKKDPESQLLYFNFYFDRAQDFYVRQIVVPTILLTYLSFLAFFLDLRIGERLSFGMALAVVVVAQQIITAERLPVSRSKLWIDYLVSLSFYWLIFVMIESVVVGHLYFLQEDYKLKEDERRDQDLMLEESNQGARDKTAELKRSDSLGWVQVGDESKNSRLEPSVEAKTLEPILATDEENSMLEPSVDTKTSEPKQVTEPSFGAKVPEPNLTKHEEVSNLDNAQKFNQSNSIGTNSKAKKGVVGGFKTLKQKMQQRKKNSAEQTSLFQRRIRSSQNQGSCAKWAREYDVYKIDRICFLVCAVSYSLFLVIMFATIDRWGANENPFVVGQAEL